MESLNYAISTVPYALRVHIYVMRGQFWQKLQMYAQESTYVHDIILLSTRKIIVRFAKMKYIYLYLFITSLRILQILKN